MKGTVSVLVAAVALCVAVSAPALAADPAEAMPADALAYVEISRAATQEALGFVALPPAAGLAQQMERFHDRFAHLDRAVGLPPGTVNDAAGSVDGAAFCITPAGPMAIVTFDEEYSPERLLPAAQPLNAEKQLGVRGQLLCIASPPLSARFANGDYESLSERASFRAARERYENAEGWGYVDVPGLMQLARATAAPSEVRELEVLWTMLGLREADYAGIQVDTDEPAFNAVVELGPPAGGFLNRLPQRSLDLVSLVPENPSAALVVQWDDPAAFLGGLRDDLIEARAEHGAGPTAEQIASTEARFGVTLDDLSAQLGEGIAVFLPRPAPEGLLRPEQLVGVLPLSDVEGFRTSLAQIATAATGRQPTRRTVAGRPTDALMMPPLTVTYLQDRAVIGMAPAAIEDYVEWLDSGATPLTEEPPDAAGLLYLDTGLLTKSYPEPEPGTQLLFTLGRAEREARFALSTAGPVPSLRRAYMGYTALMAAMLMPSLSRARSEAQKATGRSNLRNIGLAIAMYRSAHGRFPATLDVLVEEGFLDSPEVLVAPADDNPPQTGANGYPCSYEYPGALPMEVPPSFVIAYTRSGVYRDGRNVLYADGAVQFVPESRMARGQGGRGMSFSDCHKWLLDRRDQLPEQADLERIAEFYNMTAP